jgi:hypothetical protein
MARTLVSVAELQRLMLTEIRNHEGCEDVSGVGISASDTPNTNNWSAAVVGWGSARGNVAKRAAMYAQSMLGLKYGLLPDIAAHVRKKK